MTWTDKLHNPLPKSLVQSGSTDSDCMGLLIGTMSARIHLADYRSIELSEGSKTLKVPVECRKVLVSLGGWTVQFGRNELDSSRFSQFYLDYGIESFDHDKVKLLVRSGLRDRLGDMAWEGSYELTVLLFK